jgi:hypothetical protein
MSSSNPTICGEDCAGSVGVDQFFLDGDLAAASGELLAVARTACMTASRRSGSVSRMSSCSTTRLGTLLTAPGKTVAGADGGDGVDRSRAAFVASVAFDGEDEFGGGAERVFAVGHQQRSRVAAEAGDGEAVAGRARRCW